MSYRPRFTITPALQKDTRARNAHSSTAIEGNPLTPEQVRAVKAGEELVVPARARTEVVTISWRSRRCSGRART